MADKESEPSKQAEEAPPLDLNSLTGLDFGPSWADGSSSAGQRRFDGERGGRGGRPKGGFDRGGGSGGKERQDRRKGGAPDRARRDGGRFEGKGGRPAGGRGPAREEMFEPTVEIEIYPQDEAFDALVKRLRATARTYQLFEITRLLLEKPERFVLVVANKRRPGDDGSVRPLYFSVPGHLPFETEDAAITHVLTHHLDLFFDIEEVEVDAPKGNFPMVNRCTLTGELLGPPNYHRYQEFLQRHYANRIHGMPFDRFLGKVETVKDPEAVERWLDSMKKGYRYILKDRAEGEPESFDSFEAARFFLLQHRKDKIVGSGDSVRFAGRDIERLPRGDLRRSVEAYIEQQRRFPLESANNIRGRLRRHKFTVYKKGSKGVSFVCAVKRKFRDGKTVFTDSIRDLIDFIEKHPEIPASKLSKEFIGIDAERNRPEKLKMGDHAAPVEAAGASAEDAEAPPQPEQPEQRETEAGESTPVVVEAAVEVTPKDELSEEERKRLNQLMIDLRWLIMEGYVTEYGDGRLFAPPPMPEPKKEEVKGTAKAAPSVESGKAEEEGSVGDSGGDDSAEADAEGPGLETEGEASESGEVKT